jgi:multidrug efflux pump subunit AcrB
MGDQPEKPDHNLEEKGPERPEGTGSAELDQASSAERGGGEPPSGGGGDGTGEQHSLGVAGGMAHAFINSPLTPLILLASLAMGILGLLLTPRQEDPEISVPMVDIYVSYPGASSEQVASLAIDPLERLMSEIDGVKHVYSASHRGRGMVTVEFRVGQEMVPSLLKLYDKLASNLDLIPPGVSEPMVKPKGVDDVPIVDLTFWSRDVDDAGLRALALDVLQHLKEVPNTGIGFVVGGRSEQIRVEALPRRLSGFDMSLDELANTIRTANSEQQVGHIEMGKSNFTVFSGSFLRSAAEVARLVVGIRKDQPVYVSDLANVSQGPEETSRFVTYTTGPAGHDPMVANGEPAVTLAIAKKHGSNGVTVANDVLAMVNSLKGSLIPDNVNVSVTRNYGKTANDKVNELLFKLFVATGAVTILVLLTLGLRPAFVVLIVIPIVILVTVFFALLLKYSINRVSLFALIFAIGILVDDAIVVIENVYRRWLLQGTTDIETAVDAVREVGNPTIVATFTVIAALLPMAFVSGMMGPYMRPIPILGSVAMLFSLFAAFVFTPWLALRTKPSLKNLEKAEQRERTMHQRLARVYDHVLVPLIENRALGWLFLISIVVAWFLCASMFYTKAVVVKILPLDNKAVFNVVVDMPSGTALPVTANLTRTLVEAMRKNVPEITAMQSYVGTASPFDFNGMVRHYYLRNDPWQSNIEVQLLEKDERKRTNHEIAMAARELLTPIAREGGARNITVVEMPPGPPVLQSVVAEVYGPTDGVRRRVAAEMTDIFKKVPYMGDVDNYMLTPHDVLHFRVDTEKAVRRAISTDTVNRNLAMAMGGHKLGDVKQGKPLEPIYVVLQVPLQERSQLGRLLDLPVPSAAEIPVIPQALAARTVPLAELGRFVREPVDPVIYHKDLRPVEYVVGEVVGWPGAPVYAMFAIQDLLKNYTTPDGVKDPSGHWFGPPGETNKSTFEWTGEWTVTYETFRDMGIAFMVALFFIYMLIVGEFGNFTLPAITIAPIPLTLLGIIPGHWLLNAAFTATSMIGFIALAGIIVRNSILLVDFARIEIERGVDVKRAVVHAVETRTRPIMITALALVLGSSVILTDPIFQGLAVSLLFGVLVSTVLTLIVIPLGCVSARKSFEPPKPEAGEPGAEAPTAPPSSTAAAVPEAGREAPRKGAVRATFGVVGKVLLGILVLLGALLGQVWRRLLLPLLHRATARQRPTAPTSAGTKPTPASAALGAEGMPASSAPVGLPPQAVSEPPPAVPEPSAPVAEDTRAPAPLETVEGQSTTEGALAPVERPEPAALQDDAHALPEPGERELAPETEVDDEPMPGEEGPGALPSRDRGGPRRRGIRLKTGLAGKDTSGG